jgi:UDP-N-acetylglucosamine:LPS N-acetylglucosamine transferase
MLYLGNMVMEAVRNGTHGIPLPWFTTKYPGPSQIAKKPQVLISAGLSGDNFDLFLEIAKILSDNPAFDLQVDKKMYDLLGVAGVELFDFTKLAFSKLSLIICRPGIGILTDAVCFNIPLLTGCSFTNKEMIHNANRIEQLGIGKKVDLRNFKLLEKEIKVLLEPTGVRLTMVKKLETQPTGGAQAAAEFINTRLAN